MMTTGAILGMMVGATLYALVLVRWPSLAGNLVQVLVWFMVSAGSFSAVGAWLAAG